MVAIRENLGLMRQVRPAGIDQVDAGQPILQGDLLGPQMLLHGQREVGAALHRGVIGQDETLAPRDPTDPGDQARSRRLAVI